MTKSVAIIQSNYIPWKGYFDIMSSVDEFVLYDDAQYTRRDWRNRNQIKTNAGLQWLTIPIDVKHKYNQRICDAEVSDPTWNVTHWKTIERNYSRAEHFAEYRERFRDLYLGLSEKNLSRINYHFLTAIGQILGIKTRLSWSMEMSLIGDATQKLIACCRLLGATTYVSGPNAKAYLDESRFRDAGVSVVYFDYDGYPEYPQLYGPFCHHVSVLDLIFNAGPRATSLMKSAGSRTGDGSAGRGQ